MYACTDACLPRDSFEILCALANLSYGESGTAQLALKMGWRGIMATFGQVQEFNLDSKQTSAFLERVQLFFQANDIAAEKQVPVLLSIIGGKTYALLSDLLTPAKPSTKSFKDLQKLCVNALSVASAVGAHRGGCWQRQS